MSRKLVISLMEASTLLDCTPGVPAVEVQTAYRRKLRETRPDLGHITGEEFDLINAARNALLASAQPEQTREVTIFSVPKISSEIKFGTEVSTVNTHEGTVALQSFNIKNDDVPVRNLVYKKGMRKSDWVQPERFNTAQPSLDVYL